jgi:hypothetical protein
LASLIRQRREGASNQPLAKGRQKKSRAGCSTFDDENRAYGTVFNELGKPAKEFLHAPLRAALPTQVKFTLKGKGCQHDMLAAVFTLLYFQ